MSSSLASSFHLLASYCPESEDSSFLIYTQDARTFYVHKTGDHESSAQTKDFLLTHHKPSDLQHLHLTPSHLILQTTHSLLVYEISLHQLRIGDEQNITPFREYTFKSPILKLVFYPLSHYTHFVVATFDNLIVTLDVNHDLDTRSALRHAVDVEDMDAWDEDAQLASIAFPTNRNTLNLFVLYVLNNAGQVYYLNPFIPFGVFIPHAVFQEWCSALDDSTNHSSSGFSMLQQYKDMLTKRVAVYKDMEVILTKNPGKRFAPVLQPLFVSTFSQKEQRRVVIDSVDDGPNKFDRYWKDLKVLEEDVLVCVSNEGDVHVSLLSAVLRPTWVGSANDDSSDSSFTRIRHNNNTPSSSTDNTPFLVHICSTSLNISPVDDPDTHSLIPAILLHPVDPKYIYIIYESGIFELILTPLDQLEQYLAGSSSSIAQPSPIVVNHIVDLTKESRTFANRLSSIAPLGTCFIVENSVPRLVVLPEDSSATTNTKWLHGTAMGIFVPQSTHQSGENSSRMRIKDRVQCWPTKEARTLLEELKSMRGTLLGKSRSLHDVTSVLKRLQETMSSVEQGRKLSILMQLYEMATQHIEQRKLREEDQVQRQKILLDFDPSRRIQIQMHQVESLKKKQAELKERAQKLVHVILRTQPRSEAESRIHARLRHIAHKIHEWEGQLEGMEHVIERCDTALFGDNGLLSISQVCDFETDLKRNLELLQENTHMVRELDQELKSRFS